MHWFIIAIPNVTEQIQGTEFIIDTTTKGDTKEQWQTPRPVIKALSDETINFETDTETFFETKYFRDQYRDFFETKFFRD